MSDFPDISSDGAVTQKDILMAKGVVPKPVKKAKGGIIKSSASKRADGIAQRGKTKGRVV